MSQWIAQYPIEINIVREVLFHYAHQFQNTSKHIQMNYIYIIMQC